MRHILTLASEKILGKWKVLKFEDEYYQPCDKLVDNDVLNAGPEDSVVFDRNIMHAYSSLFGMEVLPYEVMNDDTINIESERYTIRMLTDKEFSVYSETTDTISNEKFVRRMYLVRE